MLRITKANRMRLWNFWAQAQEDFQEAIVEWNSINPEADPTGIARNRANNWALSRSIAQDKAWAAYAATVPASQRSMPAPCW